MPYNEVAPRERYGASPSPPPQAPASGLRTITSLDVYYAGLARTLPPGDSMRAKIDQHFAQKNRSASGMSGCCQGCEQGSRCSRKTQGRGLGDAQTDALRAQAQALEQTGDPSLIALAQGMRQQAAGLDAAAASQAQSSSSGFDLSSIFSGITGALGKVAPAGIAAYKQFTGAPAPAPMSVSSGFSWKPVLIGLGLLGAGAGVMVALKSRSAPRRRRNPVSYRRIYRRRAHAR